MGQDHEDASSALPKGSSWPLCCYTHFLCHCSWSQPGEYLVAAEQQPTQSHMSATVLRKEYALLGKAVHMLSEAHLELVLLSAAFLLRANPTGAMGFWSWWIAQSVLLTVQARK